MIANATLRSCLLAGVAEMTSGNSSSEAAANFLGSLICMNCGAKLHAAEHIGYGLRNNSSYADQYNPRHFGLLWVSKADMLRPDERVPRGKR